MGEIDDAIEQGDVRAIVKAGVGAMIAESEGRHCQCEAPDLTGRKSYLCFACGLPNMARKSEIEAAMQQPHPYEVIERFRGGLWEGTCCDFCAWPKTHQLHQVESRSYVPIGPALRSNGCRGSGRLVPYPLVFYTSLTYTGSRSGEGDGHGNDDLLRREHVSRAQARAGDLRRAPLKGMGYLPQQSRLRDPGPR